MYDITVAKAAELNGWSISKSRHWFLAMEAREPGLTRKVKHKAGPPKLVMSKLDYDRLKDHRALDFDALTRRLVDVEERVLETMGRVDGLARAQADYKVELDRVRRSKNV